MNLKFQKTTINIYEKDHINWRLCLKNKLKKINSTNLEINCNSLNLSCKDILELTKIVNLHNCKIISFCSTSSKTIVSINSLGYQSNFILESCENNNLKVNNKDLNSPKTIFHQGTVRSGEYLDSPSDLLILGDVNPGAIVSAEGNIIIWGRLLGIAHAGSKGNLQATISALQLTPVQLRIASKVARGPKEKTKLGIAEQARIDSEGIIIAPLHSI